VLAAASPSIKNLAKKAQPDGQVPTVIGIDINSSSVNIQQPLSDEELSQ